MVSTFSSVASEFNRLSEGSWLLVAYNFGYCMSLPVVSYTPARQDDSDSIVWPFEQRVQSQENSLGLVRTVHAGLSCLVCLVREC